MIGRINGVLLEKGLDGALIDVHGVGYQVRMDLINLERLPAAGEPCALWIYTHMTESAWSLIGFHDKASRQMFQTLLKVERVGASTALSIMSTFSERALKDLIRQGQVDQLAKARGIGRKTAEVIIVKLRDVFKTDESAPEDGQSDKMGDLRSALVNFELKPAEVDRIVGKLREHADLELEELLRRAITLMRG